MKRGMASMVSYSQRQQGIPSSLVQPSSTWHHHISSILPPPPHHGSLQASLHVLLFPQDQASDTSSTVTQLENEVSSSSREAGPSFPCQQSMPGNHDQQKAGLINTISPTPPSFLPSSGSPLNGITLTKPHLSYF